MTVHQSSPMKCCEAGIEELNAVPYGANFRLVALGGTKRQQHLLFHCSALAQCTTYQFQKHLSNQINRCGPTLHAYVQLSRSEDVVLNRKASS